MANIDLQYKELINVVLRDGVLEENRTGIDAWTISSCYIKHDCKEGAPLLSLRKMPYKSILVELEGFIKGISSKKWYQERNCHFWDQWANPQKVKYGNDPETQKRMLEEDDLGIIYGNNWRDFHDPNAEYPLQYADKEKKGSDQLKSIVETLKKNPQDRRMLCSAWNPLALDYAALPACHVLWRVMVINNELHLTWYQRSVDLILGFGANIFSYYTLLKLLSLESGIPAASLTGHLDCIHIYKNHYQGAKEILSRSHVRSAPWISFSRFSSIFDWEHKHVEVLNYNPLPPIKFEVAV